MVCICSWLSKHRYSFLSNYYLFLYFVVIFPNFICWSLSYFIRSWIIFFWLGSSPYDKWDIYQGLSLFGIHRTGIKYFLLPDALWSSLFLVLHPITTNARNRKLNFFIFCIIILFIKLCYPLNIVHCQHCLFYTQAFEGPE
jgi:hypothetical protein